MTWHPAVDCFMKIKFMVYFCSKIILHRVVSTNRYLELGASPNFWTSYVPPPHPHSLPSLRIPLRSCCKSLEPLPLKFSDEIWETQALLTLIHWNVNVIRLWMMFSTKNQPVKQLRITIALKFAKKRTKGGCSFEVKSN